MDRKGGEKEMNSKILLLSVAVIAVGLFAMPSTLSLFAGQHTFINGSSVDCGTCHGDVKQEMSQGISTAHSDPVLKKCDGCHGKGNLSDVPLTRTTKGNANNTLNGAHAATTLECVWCHTGVPGEINGSAEAHQPYYYQSWSNNGTIKLNGANEACVGCHTHTVMDITWIRPGGYNLTFDWSGKSVTAWSLNATTVTNITKKT